MAKVQTKEGSEVSPPLHLLPTIDPKKREGFRDSVAEVADE